jgi:hypothetical protein
VCGNVVHFNGISLIQPILAPGILICTWSSLIQRNLVPDLRFQDESGAKERERERDKVMANCTVLHRIMYSWLCTGESCSLELQDQQNTVLF